MTDTKGTMQVDAALVRQLAGLLDETRLTEIEVEDGGRRIRVARNSFTASPISQVAPLQSQPAHGEAPVEATPAIETGHKIRSPMVGTAYLSAEPGSKPFVAVGDAIAEGQTLVIIEAMKVMNPIPSNRAGRVVRICVENGQPIEFDQTLFIVE